MPIDSFTIPLQAINDVVTKKYNVRLYVLRTDLNHPAISGNKLFKLKYNLQEAIKNQQKTLLTFGGAFSNHIAATAAAGKEHHLTTIGIIRGDKHQEQNPTLKFAMEQGMQLHYVSRELYHDEEELYEYVTKKFEEENAYLIPQGGGQ